MTQAVLEGDALSQEFEAALLSTFLFDPPFGRKYLEYLKPSHFRQPEHRIVLKCLQTVQERHKERKPPRRDIVIEEAIREIKTSVTTEQDYRAVLAITDRPISAEDAVAVRKGLKDWLRGRVVDSIFENEKLFGDIDATDRLKIVKNIVQDFESIENYEDKWDWHTPEKALSKVAASPRRDYPCWIPELAQRWGIRLPEGTTWFNAGSTGRGKSLYQIAVVCFYIWAGFAVVVIDFENDEEDFWIDLANALLGSLGQECPSDLTATRAIEIVREIAQEKCGSADAIVFVSFEDALASDLDVKNVIESLEEGTGLFYPIVCLDALGDMTSEALEQACRSEWAAQRRMVMRLTAWIKQTHRILFATLQTNRAGEKEQREGKDPSIDTQGGGISFAKKAKVFCAVTDHGLKVLKFRRAGHLRKKLLPFEYVKSNIAGNQRGYVRPRTESDLEQDARWRVVIENIRASLRAQGPLEYRTTEGAYSISPDYKMEDGHGVVQAEPFTTWLLQVGKALDLKRGSLAVDLEQRGIIERKEDRTVDRKTRTYYFLRCA